MARVLCIVPHTCTLLSDTYPVQWQIYRKGPGHRVPLICRSGSATEHAVKVLPRGCNSSQFLITKNGSPTKYFRTLSTIQDMVAKTRSNIIIIPCFYNMQFFLDSPYLCLCSFLFVKKVFMNKVNLLPLSSIERLAMTQSTSSLPAK